MRTLSLGAFPAKRAGGLTSIMRREIKSSFYTINTPAMELFAIILISSFSPLATRVKRDSLDFCAGVWLCFLGCFFIFLDCGAKRYQLIYYRKDCGCDKKRCLSICVECVSKDIKFCKTCDLYGPSLIFWYIYDVF